VEHLIISDEGAHHGFKKSAIKHESGFMNETGHVNKWMSIIINGTLLKVYNIKLMKDYLLNFMNDN